jgi:hypothetical protein
MLEVRLIRTPVHETMLTPNTTTPRQSDVCVRLIVR